MTVDKDKPEKKDAKKAESKEELLKKEIYKEMVMSVFGLLILTTLLLVFYSNVERLNTILILWFIPTGTILLFTALCFWIIQTFVFIGKVMFLFNNEGILAKYIILFLILLMVLFIYAQRDTVFVPITQGYHDFNLSVYFPVELGSDSSDASTAPTAPSTAPTTTSIKSSPTIVPAAAPATTQDTAPTSAPDATAPTTPSTRLLQDRLAARR